MNKTIYFIFLKLYVQKLDHKKAAITINNLKINGNTALKMEMTIAAILIGKMQYPRTQRLYAIDTFPPNNLEFKVKIKDPPQIIANKVPNRESVFYFECIPKVLVRSKQNLITN